MSIQSSQPNNVAEIRTLAIEAFGDELKADDWLKRKNLALGESPLSVMATENGCIEVEKILSSIIYGGVV